MCLLSTHSFKFIQAQVEKDGTKKFNTLLLKIDLIPYWIRMLQLFWKTLSISDLLWNNTPIPDAPDCLFNFFDVSFKILIGKVSIIHLSQAEKMTISLSTFICFSLARKLSLRHFVLSFFPFVLFCFDEKAHCFCRFVCCCQIFSSLHRFPQDYKYKCRPVTVPLCSDGSAFLTIHDHLFCPTFDQ